MFSAQVGNAWGMGMGMRGRDNIGPLIEPVPMCEIFATGIVQVEFRGEFVRLIFFADHELPDSNGRFGNCERMIVARLVMPTSAYHQMVRQIVDAPPLATEH